MTRSLSNVIKAYTIRYDDNDRRLIDTNAAAEEKVKYYLDLLQISQDDEASSESKEGGFVEGLTAATIETLPEEEIQPSDEEAELAAQATSQRMLEETNEKAQEILEDAKLRAEQIIAEARMEAQAQSIQIKDTAKTEGYVEGKKAALHELDEEKKQLEVKEEALKAEYETKIKEIEPAFSHLLIEYVKRFTGVVLDDKQEIILYLLEQELMNIDNSNTYLIHVSKEDYELVNSKKNEISWKVKEGAEIEIIEDRMLTHAQCLIETDSRVIDCSLDVQLKNLITDLKLLAGPKEEKFS